MSWLQRNLMQGESVVFTTRLHLINSMGYVLAAAVFSAVSLLAAALSPIPLLWIPLILVAVVFAFLAWLRIWSSVFAVTNKRIIIRQGVIRTVSSEMLLIKVESMVVEVDLWGRLLGYGTITVKGTGGSSEIFPGVKTPEAFRTATLQEVDRAAQHADPKTEP